MAQDETEETYRFWRAALTDTAFCPVPRWPPAAGSASPAETAVHRLTLPAALAARLEDLACRLGVEFQQVLMAAHVKVLATVTRLPSVRTGYRPSGSIAEGIPAPVPLCLTVEPGAWNRLIEQVSRADAVTRPHARLPLDEIRRAAGGDDPLFETSFTVRSSAPARRPPDLTAETTVAMVLSVEVERRPPDATTICAFYRSGLFGAAHIARFLGYHIRALELMAGDPGADHDAEPLLSDEELAAQKNGMNDRWTELPDQRFHELFEAQVRATPHATAAANSRGRWTYQQLNERANRIAHCLTGHGVQQGTVVGVLTDRDLGWLAAILGIFKAGGVYLPLEPGYPAERTSLMLTDARAALVLAGNVSTEGVPAGPPVLSIPEILGAGYDTTDPRAPVGARQLAYIYFTSGSTGVPKGAMCEHVGMLNHLMAKREDLALTADDVVAQNAPQCFDISLWQLICPLLAGAQTLIIDQATVLDVEAFARRLVRSSVTVVQVVPSYLDALLTYLEEHPLDLGRLRIVSVTGEAVSKSLVARWFACYPEIRLLNAYGATEASDDTTHELMSDVPEQDLVPVGRPNINVRVYVMDDQDRLVPLGSRGEIAFAGVCVGAGYTVPAQAGRPSFVPDPFHPGERMYRTGDFGRWLPTGSLEFLGRRDEQVKIRGMRIELGEVENRVAQIPGIRAVAVVAYPLPGGGRELAAFYVAEEHLTEGRLRRMLRDMLPAPMVPARYHRLRAIPLTGNGKVDKKELLARAEAARRESRHVAAATATGRRIAAAWAEVLGVPVEAIGARDNFFELGGNSLAAVRLVVKLDRLVSLSDVISHPVLQDLTDVAEGNSGGSGTTLVHRLSSPAKPCAALLCFPYASGNSINFQPLAKALEGFDIAVYAVEPPGHDLTGSGEAMLDVMAMAAQVVPEVLAEVSAPVALWGHCSGSAAALESARRLLARGIDVWHVFAAAQSLPGPAELRARIAATEAESDGEIRNRLSEDGAFTGLDALAPERVQLIGSAYRHDSCSADRYFLRADREPGGWPVAIPLTVVVAADDKQTAGCREQLPRWRRFASSVRLHQIPSGGHYFARNEPDQVARLIADTLAARS